jgi:hypothetical protein
LNHWTELRSVRKNLGKTDPVLLLEPRVGIEPTTCALPWRCSTS